MENAVVDRINAVTRSENAVKNAVKNTVQTCCAVHAGSFLGLQFAVGSAWFVVSFALFVGSSSQYAADPGAGRNRRGAGRSRLWASPCASNRMRIKPVVSKTQSQTLATIVLAHVVAHSQRNGGHGRHGTTDVADAHTDEERLSISL